MNYLNEPRKIGKLALITSGLLVLPLGAQAHCPLCTAGAGLLAVAAISFGISPIIIAVLIGAFGWTLGLWFSSAVKRQYIPLQKPVIAVLTFVLTVLPLQPLVQIYAPLHLSLGGQYGSLLYNTYLINLYLVGSVFGAVLVAIAPFVSRLVTKLRGRSFPYQGLSITILLLVLASVLIQVLV
jgi:hypothetical protein